MKYILFVLVFIVQIVELKAQQYWAPIGMFYNKCKILDSANIKITYKLTYLKDTTTPNTKYTDDEVLLLGPHISKYFSQQYVEYNKYIKQLHQETLPNAPRGTLGIEIFKDFKNNTLTVTDLKSVLQNNFEYKEEMPQIAWTMLNERQKILSYPCQNAETNFRGRKYEAWFTTEIPINNGPWKFGGLPGLILKISDTQNHYIFECTGIENLGKRESINFYEIVYTELKREEYNELIKKFHKNTIPFYKARGNRVLDMNNGGKEMIFQQLPFNPIERK